MRMRKSIVSVVAIIALAPASVLAQTTDIAAQVAGLQAQIQALIQQITTLQGVVPAQTPPSSPTGSTSACPSPALTRNLSHGMQGSDVAGLQAFLISGGYLAAGNTTGFFGNLTQAAVQRFQAAQGIVSSGGPDTTGYGAVGPRTRQGIAQVCGGTNTGIITPSPVPSGLPVVISQFTASPTQINAGQATTIVWSVQNAASCIITQQVPGYPLITLNAAAGPSGSLVSNPNATSIYSIICTSFGSGLGAAQSVTVNVGSANPTATSTPAGNNPFLSISSEPLQVTRGQTSRITWNTARVSSCALTTTPEGFYSSTALSGSQLITFSAAATTTYMFRLNCTGPNGTYASSTSVRVTPTIAYELTDTGVSSSGYGSATISQSKIRTGSGEKFILSWSSSGMNSCSITKYTPGSQPQPWCTGVECGTNSSREVIATTLGTHAYVLKCSGLHGQAYAQMNHVVTQQSTGDPANNDIAFTASPSSGTAPLGVAFTGSVPGSGYKINFGDNTADASVSCTGTCTGRTTINTSHTYNSPGVYTAKVSYACETGGTSGYCSGPGDTIVIRATQLDPSSISLLFSTPLAGTTISPGQNANITWSTLNPPAGSKVRLEVYKVGEPVIATNNDHGLAANSNELPTTGSYSFPITLGVPAVADGGHGGVSLQGGQAYRIVGKLYTHTGTNCWGFCSSAPQRTIFATAEGNSWTVGLSPVGPITITKTAAPTLVYKGYPSTWTFSAPTPAGTTLSWKAEWKDGNTDNQSTPSFTHTYNTVGTYNAVFSVTASNGSSGVLVSPVTVVDPGSPTSGGGSYSGALIAAPTSGAGPLVARFDVDFPLPDNVSGLGYLSSLTWGDGRQAVPSCATNNYGFNNRCLFTGYHLFTHAGTYNVELRGNHNCPGGVTPCIIGTANIVVTGSMPEAGSRCRVARSALGATASNNFDNIDHGQVRGLRTWSNEPASNYMCINGTWYCNDITCPLGDTEIY